MALGFCPVAREELAQVLSADILVLEERFSSIEAVQVESKGVRRVAAGRALEGNRFLSSSLVVRKAFMAGLGDLLAHVAVQYVLLALDNRSEVRVKIWVFGSLRIGFRLGLRVSSFVERVRSVGANLDKLGCGFHPLAAKELGIKFDEEI